MIFWIAQMFGMIGMVFNMASFQCKTKPKMMLVLGVGSSMFFMNFLLLGAYASAVFNIINIIRSVCIIKKSRYSDFIFGVLLVLYLVTSLLTYQNLWTLVLLLSQFAATFAMWYKSEKFIRTTQLSFVSPVWLINNIFVSVSIGGTICEVFTIISTVIALIRFRTKNTAAERA